MRNRPTYKIEILGTEITKRRLSRALSRKELAALSGVSFDRINKIEAGLAGGVSPETVQKLCSFFGCEPQDISEVLEVAS